MKGPAGDEEDVVGVDDAVAGLDGCSLHQRQQVALHAVARDVRAGGAGVYDFVNLVDEDDAVFPPRCRGRAP